MMKEITKTEVENTNNELGKAVLLIKNVQENLNELFICNDPAENALLCLKYVKALEEAEYIITNMTDDIVGFMDYYNGELTKANSKMTDEYVNSIINK